MRTKIARLRKLVAWAERYGLNDDEIVCISDQIGAHLTPQAVARIWPERLTGEPWHVAADGVLHFRFADEDSNGCYEVACMFHDEQALAALREQIAEASCTP